MSFLLAHLLTQDKLITYDEMVTIFSRRQKRQEQPTTLDAELCKNGHLTPLQANTYLARVFDVPPIDLKALQQVDGSVILQVTPSIAKTYKVFPYLSDGATLQLATTIDFDPENQGAIEKKLGLKIQCTPISQIFMAQLLELHYAVIPSKTLRPLLDKWPLDKQVPTTETPQAKAPKDPLAGLLDGIAGLDAFGDLDLSADLQNLSKQNLTAVQTDIPKDIDASSDALPAVTEEVTSTPAPVETSTTPTPIEEPAKNNIALSMDDLEYLFEHTQTRTGMIEVGMRFCEKFVDQAGFLLVPKDKVVGYRLPGAPDLEKAFKSIEISLDSDSIFNRLRESYVPYAGPPPESEADRFMFMLFYPPPEVIYLFAIRLKGRPVAVLYGHRNNGLLSEDEFAEFTRCAELMELTLEQILLKFKQGIKDESQTVKHALKAIQMGNREALASVIPSFQAIEEVEAEEAPTEPEAAQNTPAEPEEDDDLLIDEPDFLPSQASLDAVPAHTVDLPGPSSAPVAVETPTSVDETPVEEETTSEEEPPEVDTTTDEPATVTADSNEAEQQTPETDAPETDAPETSTAESNAEEPVAENPPEETVTEEPTSEETVTEETTSEETVTEEESKEEQPASDDVPETTSEEATTEALEETTPEEPAAKTSQDEESAEDSSQATDSVEEASTETSDDATPTAEESAATEDETTETGEASNEASEAPAETDEQPADTTSAEEAPSATDENEEATDKSQRPSKDEPPSKNRPPQEDISVFSNIYQTHEAATSVSSDSLDIKEKKEE